MNSVDRLIREADAEWITTTEAARRLSCTPPTIRAMCVRGELLFMRIGGRAYRVLASSIEPSAIMICIWL